MSATHTRTHVYVTFANPYLTCDPYPCPTVRSLADIWRDHPEHPGRQQ